MKGVILAAGKGKRMSPLTPGFDKPMLPVANKPVLEHIVDALRGAGITEICVVVSPGSEVPSCFGDDVKYFEQKEQLGTAHALGVAKDFLKEDFIVTNGDDLISSEFLKSLMKGHKSAAATLSLVEMKDLTRVGCVEVEGDLVKSIVEKPGKGEEKSNLAGTGTYVFSAEIFDTIDALDKSERGEYEIPGALEKLIADGKKVTWVKAESYRPITYPWDLLAENKGFLDVIRTDTKNATVEKGATLNGVVVAGKGTVIKSGTYIEGPVVIGENCTIGPNSYIRPYTTLGNDVKVGQSVEIKNSIIMEGTKVPHLTYIGDSVVGKNCNFGAGTVLTNLRFDDGNVVVKVNGEKIDTGTRKLGAIIGHNVKTGSNVTVLPGRKIGSNAVIYPGKVVDRDIEENGKFR